MRRLQTMQTEQLQGPQHRHTVLDSRVDREEPKTQPWSNANHNCTIKSLNPAERHSLYEMRSFIGQMQQKYGLESMNKSCQSAANQQTRRINNATCTSKNTSTCCICQQPASATLPCVPVPATSGPKETPAVINSGEVPASLVDTVESSLAACNCNCRCSAVAEEAASLRVLLADLSERHSVLQRGKQH